MLQKAFATRKVALSALKNGDYAFAAGESCSTSCPKPFFFEMISFFLHSVSANPMVAKKRGNARKTPEIVRFRGFEAMISFLASQYGASGDTELFEKASNINGFQGGRVANNLYISPFWATVFQTAALFLYPNSSAVIWVENLRFLSLWLAF